MMKTSNRHVHLHRVPLGAPEAVSLKERALVWLASFISSPYVYPLFKHTFLGQCGYIGQLRRTGHELEALEVIIGWLEGYSNGAKQPIHLSAAHWWYFMRLCVVMLQQQQVKGHAFNYTLVHYLLALSLSSFHPREGFDASYAMIGFALWSIQEGAMLTAYTCTHLAIIADPTWGYPHYLHGWTGLIGQGRDPLSDFTQAIQMDWSLLHAMKTDPLLEQYPQLLDKIQKSLLVKSSSSKVIH